MSVWHYKQNCCDKLGPWQGEAPALPSPQEVLWRPFHSLPHRALGLPPATDRVRLCLPEHGEVPGYLRSIFSSDFVTEMHPFDDR